MEMMRRIINYIKDKNFKIMYLNNSVNVVNYDKIVEIKSDVITLLKEDKLIFIKGNDLRLNKLMDNEILIVGLINKIEL